LYQLWDENAAAAGGLVFIPSLLVGAAHFSTQVVYYGTVPCYWLFVDILILCYTISVVTSCIDIAADLYCFLARINGDSVPLIIGKDNAASYPKTFNQRIFWAMVFRVFGSTFALLLLTSATAMTLVPLAGAPGPTANTTFPSGVIAPPQCAAFSDPSYHLKLFFGFFVVAVVFAALRLAFVHQSKKNGSHDDYHHAHDRHHHDHKHNDDYHHELAVISTPKGDDKKVGEPKREPEKDLGLAVQKEEGKPSEEKEAEEKEAEGGDDKDGSSEESEDSEERRKRRRDRRRKRRERRERRKRDEGSDDDDDD